MKEILLTKSKSTLVDDGDFDWVSQRRRSADWNPDTESFYAVRHEPRDEDGKQEKVYLHREIMGLNRGDPRDVHHVNGDTLDNRRENLEVVTKMEHANVHRNDPRKDVSPYGIGVQRLPSGSFRSKARVSGKQKHIGTYPTVEEAQKARELFLEKSL